MLLSTEVEYRIVDKKWSFCPKDTCWQNNEWTVVDQRPTGKGAGAAYFCLAAIDKSDKPLSPCFWTLNIRESR
jgi:hypothetical protein